MTATTASPRRAVRTASSRRVTDIVGMTPLIAPSHLTMPGEAELLLKWERANPGGSIKDRPALHIVRTAEELGMLGPGSTIIESSSGNFGISLAMIGAARGYRVIVLVDSKTTSANLRILSAYGAETIVVDEPDDTGSFHKTRIVMANRLAREIPGAFRPDQVFNLLNSQAHVRTTGPEILAECEGRLDVFVGTASSGGQLGGVSRYLRDHAPHVRVVGADARGSLIFGGTAAPYLIPGVGLGWTPANLDLGLLDAAFQISAEDAFYACRVLAQREGILAGASSGAATIVALRCAMDAGSQRRVVCLASDGGDRYLDSVYDDQWLADHGIELPEPDVDELRRRARALRPVREGPLRPTVVDHIQEILEVPDSTASINTAACREWVDDDGTPTHVQSAEPYR